MDIENLTIKQVRELQGFFSETNKEKKSLKYPLGSYVIVRSRNEGINSGFLIQASSVMTDCEKYGMTYGCNEECPVLIAGKCEFQDSDNKELYERALANER